MKGIRQVSTRNMSRAEWLELRKKSIGGSDAAAVLGLSKYGTPYTVWADKTGKLPDKPDSEAMRLGRDLEDYVARRWQEETGKKVRRLQAMLYNPLYPFAHADVDRMVVGEDAGLECKTTSSLDLKQFRGVEFPEQYYCQCVHYMAVTGAKRWYLAVLVFGRGFFVYTLDRDQAEIDALMDAEGRFWYDHVAQDAPPPPDGSEATAEALQTIYAESDGGECHLIGREKLLDEYMELKQQKKALDSRLGEIANIIKEEMRELERGSCGLYSVSWRSQRRSIFQAEDFARSYPGIDLTPFYKTVSSRPFQIRRLADE